MKFHTGDRVVRVAHGNRSGETGTVLLAAQDATEFPYVVKWDNIGMELCSPDEVDVI
jgi:hypothetical protein